MRSLLLVAAAAFFALPASAQTVQCEISAYDEAVGEVMATYDLDRAGQVQRLTMSFMPERVEGVGEESDYFARPRILLEYRMNDSGELVGPNVANVLITRFSNPGAGRPPAMSTVEIRVTAPSVEALTWNGADSSTGERRFAAMVRDQKPSKLKVDIVGKDGKTLASAEFDLSKTALVQKLIAQAKADGEKRVAAFQKLAGEGAAPTSCPAG
jgi:hypothetical protein